MSQEEHRLQCACVRWFGYQHPELRGLLFAVPNGGARSKALERKLDQAIEEYDHANQQLLINF